MKKLTKSELNPPGVCLRCQGVENREWFLDTDIFLDYVGNLYICCHCLDDFINAAGGLTREAAEEADRLATESLREIEAAYDQEVEELKGIQSIAGMTLTEIVQTLAFMAEKFEEIENGRADERTDSVSVADERDDDATDDEPDGSDEQTERSDNEFLLAEFDGAVTGGAFGLGI